MIRATFMACSISGEGGRKEMAAKLRGLFLYQFKNVGAKLRKLFL